MARLRRPVSAALAAVLACGLLSATGGAATAAPSAPAAEGGRDEMSVVELDLAGVEPAVLPDLPDPASVPFAEDDQPAPTAPEARRATGVLADADAPSPTASPDAAPAPTAEPTPEPSAEPTQQPSEAPADEAPAEPVDPDVLTVEMDTAPFTVLGVTWDRTPGLDEVEIRYRVRVDGTWSEWQGAEAADVAPDATSQDAEGAYRDGTDPIVAVGADGVQIWAEAGSGTVSGLKAVLVDPGADPADVGATVPVDAATVPSAVSDGGATFQNLGTATTSAVRTAAVARPSIISRAGWGADESLRTCDPDMSTQMVSAAVHHTASANGYSAAEVPGILRGFYAYHTRPEAAGGRGWCDIGYNFLVDQFGRVFEGRAGGVESTAVGVHTGGFNSRTIGVAAIGNFQTAAPSAQLLESLSQLIAWKFAVHRIPANANVQMVSGGGASKYPAGTVVTFPTIYAHRDAQLTSCPGQSLYDRLGDIRNRVAALANATVSASPVTGLETFAATGAGIQVAGWTYDPDSDASLQVAVSVDGAVTRVPANRSRPDVGAAHGVGPNHGFSAVVPAGNGRHLVCVSSVNVGAGHDVVLGCKWLTVRNATPIGALDAITTTATDISVRGWALDPDTNASIAVHVYVDGRPVRAVTANGSRPDVGAAYGKGDAHGFATTVPATGGQHQVCLYLINQPAGANPQLACRTVQVGDVPFGSLDGVTAAPGQVTLRGWAIDRDTRDPIAVHVYVDGKHVRTLQADGSRPDVDRVYGLGALHGFGTTLPVADGRHDVCVYLINTPSGPNPLLGCRAVTVANAAPIGALDVARGTATGIRVQGWALDPDTTAPIGVHVYVDGLATRSLAADRNRPDVHRAYGLGAAHGYDVEVPATAGAHEVCLYLINQPAGANPLLACRSVTTG
jgi:hypothetical protein